MIIAAGVAILVALIVVGMPVGFALGVAGLAGLVMTAPMATIAGLLVQVVHDTVANYVLLTIPMFVLMSEFLRAGGVAQDLMLSCNRLMRRVRGGLAMACVLAGAILAAASGSSTASVATMSGSSFPTMRQLGYHPGFALGTIAISGTLAILIPPSIALVVYGIVSEESIGKLFIAGLFPGLLTAVGYIFTISLCVWRRPDWAPGFAEAAPSGSQVAQKGRVWPAGLLVLLVLGSLYGGIATPTEVGAIGALGALVIAVAMGRISPRGIVGALGNTVRTTTMIVVIIIGAILFGYFMTFSRITPAILSWVRQSALSPYAVLVLILAVYLVLGMLMDQFAILVLTVPVTHSIITALGFDGVWFGVLVVKTAEIGLVTPPVGLNVFIASATTGVPAKDGFLGVGPFVIVELAILAALVAFPSITLSLVNVLG